MSITKQAAVVICGAALLAASAPTVASGVGKVTDVFITNGDDKPVPTKAIGTTAVSGAVSVPGGVSVNGKPDVAVPDGVSINGTVPVTSAAPERYNRRFGATHADDGSSEVCTPVEVPDGKRLVVDVVHFEAEAGDVADTYVRQVTDMGPSGFLFDRFRPEPTSGNGGRLEGPFIGDDKSTLTVCAREAARLAAVVVGTLEDE